MLRLLPNFKDNCVVLGQLLTVIAVVMGSIHPWGNNYIKIIILLLGSLCLPYKQDMRDNRL